MNTNDTIKVETMMAIEEAREMGNWVRANALRQIILRMRDCA